MNNDNIELLKYVVLSDYAINKNKTTFFVDPSTKEMFINFDIVHSHSII